MVQPGAIIRVAYVHAGALAHRIQAFQDFDTGGVVRFRILLFVGHIRFAFLKNNSIIFLRGHLAMFHVEQPGFFVAGGS
ncbi:MAG TPA: hypothetical protein VL027_02385, partial [Spongiibacteraceae bacterium]|nr:hypothetical protein [Spongiibacteraceae bacterium]